MNLYRLKDIFFFPEKEKILQENRVSMRIKINILFFLNSAPETPNNKQVLIHLEVRWYWTV